MTTITRTAVPATVPVIADPHRPRGRDLALLLGVPIAWAALLVFHPTGDGDEFYPILRDQLGAWNAVHLGMALFIPLMAYAISRLTAGLRSPAARVGRALLPIGTVVYSVYEALLGLGTGALVDKVNELPDAERAVGASLVEDYVRDPLFRVLEYTGSLTFAAAVVATTVALRSAKLLTTGPQILFVLSALLIPMHVPPFGPVGLGLFVVAVLWMRRTGDVVRAAY